MDTKLIEIYQIYYNEETKYHCLPELFIPYDNSGVNDGEYEFSVMKKLYESDWSNREYLGVISWKFDWKIQNMIPESVSNNIRNIRISPRYFTHSINQNYGKYDIYHINPWPKWDEYNTWHQGEMFHSKMLYYLKVLQQIKGIGKGWDESVYNKKCLNYCNYWVANKKTWDLYMEVAMEVYPVVKGTEIFPYLMERVISSVLHDNQDDLKIYRCKI